MLLLLTGNEIQQKQEGNWCNIDIDCCHKVYTCPDQVTVKSRSYKFRMDDPIQFQEESILESFLHLATSLT